MSPTQLPTASGPLRFLLSWSGSIGPESLFQPPCAVFRSQKGMKENGSPSLGQYFPEGLSYHSYLYSTSQTLAPSQALPDCKRGWEISSSPHGVCPTKNSITVRHCPWARPALVTRRLYPAESAAVPPRGTVSAGLG